MSARSNSVNPTTRLLLGLGVISAAVALFSLYSLRQIDGLRVLQLDAIDRNRRDSLQLLRIQNNLQNLALSMRDMTEGAAPYPLVAYRAEFDRTQLDLQDALERERRLAPTARTIQQQSFLTDSLQSFWDVMDEMFQEAEIGDEQEARRLIRQVLQPRFASISTTVARLLISNNEAEQEAALEIELIYDNVQRNTYYFMAAVFVAIFLTGAYMVSRNRRVFGEIAQLSEERQQLAGRLITVQEDLFESIARELHDEFGQALTAAGAMLTRLERKAGAGSRAIREIRSVTHEALEGVRRLSQRLHPNVLDDYGLEGAIEWHSKQIRDQTGIDIDYHPPAESLAPIDRERAIHIYRILQEALSNVVKHSRANDAVVRIVADGDRLLLEIEDNGAGFSPDSGAARGLGLVAMRERAKLIQGALTIEQLQSGGTVVRLEAPIMSTKK